MFSSFVEVQFVRFLNKYGTATSIDSFPNACKTSGSKKTSSENECFEYPDKMQYTEHEPIDVPYSILFGCNLLEAQYSKHAMLVEMLLITEQASVNYRLW